MEASQIIFFILSAIIVVGSIMSVVSRKLLHAATYLLFVLIATAGLYLLLNFHFLAAVQLSVYVGGILVLFVFAIFLTSQVGELMPQSTLSRRIMGSVIVLSGFAFSTYVLMTHKFKTIAQSEISELDMQDLGTALIGTDMYQYLLPFEAISVLLLACIIGGILIARKR